MAFHGFNWVIEMMHRTVGTPVCGQFRAIDDIGINGNVLELLSANF